MSEYDVTLSSMNEELVAYVAAPANKALEICCTSFTAQTSIIILNDSDFIDINNYRYYFNDVFIEMTEEIFVMLLNEVIKPSGVSVSVTNAHLLVFMSDVDFTINDMSYNVKLLTGLFWDSIKHGKNITGDCVPYYLGTPVLYLVSNLGSTNYTNVTNPASAATGMQTLMKINNSVNRCVPIIAGNCDYVTRTTSNVLSQSRFLLVDQNLVRVKLLNPFTITLKIRVIETDKQA